MFETEVSSTPHKHVVGLQTGDKANGPSRDLRHDLKAFFLSRFHQIQAVAPLVGSAAILCQCKCALHATGSRDLSEELDFLLRGPMFRACDVADNAGWHSLKEASPRRFDGMANG